ncbi:MAG: hypothetical protein NVS4B6_17090 [Mycobacterium sp.]
MCSVVGDIQQRLRRQSAHGTDGCTHGDNDRGARARRGDAGRVVRRIGEKHQPDDPRIGEMPRSHWGHRGVWYVKRYDIPAMYRNLILTGRA